MVAAELRDKARDQTLAWDYVEELTTRFGPRPAGSASEKAACEWAAAEFRRLGFDRVSLESFPLTLWQRGEERVEITAPFAQSLVATTLGGSPATPPEGIEAEAAVFETYQDLLDVQPGGLAGKVAVVLQDTIRAQDGAGYGSSSRIRSEGPREAKARGAVAFLLRSLGTHEHRFAHTGATRQADTVPSFAISPPDAAQIARVLRRGGPLRVKLLTRPTAVPSQSHNVIADVVGREKPEEIVLIGAHIDSWDLGTGAIDDGAGCAIVTAAAKLMIDVGYRPRRTVRVVLFGSEEVSQPVAPFGLFGARHYASTRQAEWPNHVIASESDFGARKVYALQLPAGHQSSDFQKRAMRLLTPLGVIFDGRPATSGGPDITPLVQGGVPAFRLNQDGSDYFDFHHTKDDVLERIDREELKQNVAAWAALVWAIADSDVTFRA